MYVFGSVFLKSPLKRSLKNAYMTGQKSEKKAKNLKNAFFTTDCILKMYFFGSVFLKSPLKISLKNAYMTVKKSENKTKNLKMPFLKKIV